MKKNINAGIIGCGLIGRKRALNAGKFNIVSCCDTNKEVLKTFVREFGIKEYKDYKSLIDSEEVHAIFVCTLHDSLYEIVEYAILKNIHVLVEKPAAKNLEQIIDLTEKAKNSKAIVRVGFNHRFHRAFRKLNEILEKGVIGDLMFLRSRYGHGGRLGYDKEWRSNPQLSGGGELMDQGPHIIDLSRMILGEFKEISGFADTFFWNMKVDDNAFMILRTEKGHTAFLHVSCTEWKNTFSMEVYGKLGKVEINGLGGSYGLEKITLYKMLPEMGPPMTESWEYPMQDDSWEYENNEFFTDIALKRPCNPGLGDALECHKIVDTIYKKSNFKNGEKIDNN